MFVDRAGPLLGAGSPPLSTIPRRGRLERRLGVRQQVDGGEPLRVRVRLVPGRAAEKRRRSAGSTIGDHRAKFVREEGGVRRARQRVERRVPAFPGHSFRLGERRDHVVLPWTIATGHAGSVPAERFAPAR